MKIASTVRQVETTSALEALPDTRPNAPGFVTAASDPDTSRDWEHVMASAGQIGSLRADLLAVLGDPVMDATELATSVMASALPGKEKYVIKGVWWVLNLAEKGIKLWDASLQSEVDRHHARDKSVVPVASLDFGAHVLGGLALFGESTAPTDPVTGAAIKPGYVDLSKDLKLLIKAGRADLAGGTASDVFFQAAVGSASPAYGPFMQMLKLMEPKPDGKSQAERLGIYPGTADVIKVLQKNARKG